VYGLHEYGNMLRDRVRTQAYREAIDRHLRPDSVVLDLGAGTGAFALYAAIKGARKVYAVETSPLIEYGRQEAQRLGLGERIEFHHGSSQEFEPELRSNMLISDLRGALPFLGDAFAVLADAKARLLTSDATLMPQRDQLFAAPVEDFDWYKRDVESPWLHNDLELPMPLLREAEGSLPRRPPPRGLTPCFDGQRFATLDYTAPTPSFAPTTLSWTAQEKRTIHCYLLWFDAELVPGVGMSAAPGAKAPMVYGRLTLPLLQPIELAAGDQLDLRLSVWPAGGDYAYTWTTTVRSADGSIRKQLRQHSAHEAFLAARTTGLA